MQPILAISENVVSAFKFPSPKEISPPIIKIENGSVGYNEKIVLNNINVRLDHDDRIALLGANGEGKSTLSKLLAGKISLINGEIIKSGKLKVGFFAQHQLEELTLGESPFEHFSKLLTEDSISKIRAKLGAAGINSDIADNPVEKLSGGQKARLMMALATIEAPHLLILDEPTNHLDIESREALVHALNDFSGAVIIVSHDVHLVEMIADRLWLVKSGKVTQYDGDINDYRKKLLSDRSNKPKIKNITAPLKRNDENDNLVVSITTKIKNCEKKIELLLKKKNETQKMISGSAGINLQSYQINQIKNKLDKISKEIEEEEKHWLALQE
jgi:ATP-binding cassette subfamily F protein 3